MIPSPHLDTYFESLNTFPSLNQKIEKTKQGFYLFYYFSDFQKIHSITLQNTATQGTSEKIGDFDPNISSQLMMNYQLIKSLSNLRFAKTFGISFIAPIPEFIIIDSTSSFLPKYYWYDSKINKTELLGHIIQEWTEHWSSAITVKGNWDVSSQSEMTTGLQGSGTSSSGRIQGKTKPYFIPQASILWSNQNNKLHLSFTPSSKQKLQNKVIGQAPLGGATNVNYSFALISQTHFEPMQLKLDFHKILSSSFGLALAINYEDWSSIPSTVLETTDVQGSVTASRSFEQLKGKKIISPAIAMDFKTSEEQNQWSLSYRHKPSVIEKDYALSGNTIDQPTHILGLGLVTNKYPIKISLGAQIHIIPKKRVTKTSLQEDDSSGHKIGYPEYHIEGTFTVLSIGANYNF